MTTLRKLPTIAPRARATTPRSQWGGTSNAECRMQNAELRKAELTFYILHSAFFILHLFLIAICSELVLFIRKQNQGGGEWGLVAPAVFKTVVSARKRRKVGSIPTRLRQIRQKAEGRKQKSWRRWD